MTEPREDDRMVSVKAQVMTRDESTQGWLPLAGGGMANVSVRKRPRMLPHESHEYIIYGQRVCDQTVILSCVIDRNLEYNKVMPTFHHWKTGKQRNGLTFQTAADARAFDRCVRSAYLQMRAEIECIENGGDLSMYKFDDKDEQDDFMSLNLPMDPNVTRSPPSEYDNDPLIAFGAQRTSSTLPPTQPLHTIHQQKHQLQFHTQQPSASSEQTLDVAQSNPGQSPSPAAQQNIHIISFEKTGSAHQYQPATHFPSGSHMGTIEQPTSIAPGDNYSYVQMTAFNDSLSPFSSAKLRQAPSTCTTSFPASGADSKQESPSFCGRSMSFRRDSIDSLKKVASMSKVSSTSLEKGMQKLKIRRRCRYCQELYAEDWNKKGSCSYAPDSFRTSIEQVSAITCARCMVYHCMSDAEGESVQNVCSCTSSIGDGGVAGTGAGASNNCKKRWFGLVLLSFICPCLCCYPPLRACHWMCVKCGLCGGRHKPQN